jgi:SpoVK/Ycf46/Vps4 family AAA+-type ATPase
VPAVPVPPGIEGIVGITELPDPDWSDRWDRIVVDAALKERLLNYLVFSLRHRGRLSAVSMPLHGLVVLAGPPGTGKTTLAGGLVAESSTNESSETVISVVYCSNPTAPDAQTAPNQHR